MMGFKEYDYIQTKKGLFFYAIGHPHLTGFPPI